jgi:hypothetical protein
MNVFETRGDDRLIVRYSGVPKISEKTIQGNLF